MKYILCHMQDVYLLSTILAASAGWRKLKCEVNMCVCGLLFWSVLCWWIHFFFFKWVVFQRVEMKKDVWNGKMVRTFIWRTWKLNKLKFFYILLWSKTEVIYYQVELRAAVLRSLFSHYYHNIQGLATDSKSWYFMEKYITLTIYVSSTPSLSFAMHFGLLVALAHNL